MNTSTITLLTFSAGALAATGIVSLLFDLVLRNRMRIDERLNDEFREKLKQRARKSPLFKNLNPFADRPDDDVRTLSSRLRAMIEQAGSTWSVEHFASLTLLLGTLVTAGVCLAGAALWSGIAAGLVAAAAPLAYLCARRNRRQQRLCEQLPEAFELMSRAVRAGQTISSAFQLLARECKPPLSEEFAYCCEQQNLGLSQEMTLRDLARRNDVMELQMFVVAMLVQRQSGGNPVELLDNLSGTIRKRLQLVGKVRALTSEGRLQAVVLSVLPLVAFGILLIVNPGYAQELLDRPMLIAGVLTSETIGALWIQRMIKIDY
ncbi:MAG: type II secretion system F family protein [Planctomycetaceae bacterium]